MVDLYWIYGRDICTRRFQTRSSHKPQQSLRRSVLQNNMKYARAVQILLLLLTLQLWVATASGLPFLQRFWSPLNLNHRRSAPRFPTNFQANYTFSLPYVSAYQKQGLSYPISVWKNGDHLRIDSGDGSDGHAINSLITQPDAQFELSPRIDRMNCLRLEKDDDIELQNTAFGEHALNAVLPDMAHWEFRGSETLDSKDVDLWVLEQKHEAKVVLYKFWVEPLEDEEYDRPVLLTLHGNALDGSHFDDWRYEFQSFTPRAPSESVFALPALCATVAAQPLSCRTPHAMRMLSLLPPTIKSFGDDPAYALFSAVHGRTHESHADFSVRLGAFRSSLGLIAAHNAKADKSYTLAINKFADWTEEEFRGVMLPGRGLRANKVQPPAELLHQRTVHADRIPRTVDWSKTGADQVVKDQSACGSCWAFGAAGAMQASWFMHTGEQLLFSEQQLMDCSWGHTENKACDGGLAEGAFDWAAKNGGVALESNIPYRGQDDFCTTLDGKSGKSRSGQRIKFKGYKEVAVDDNEAVMEALYTKGPLAISIDAGQPGFRFYSEGVYDELTCGWKAADLDHSVMLVGYGETEGGKEYWHVKNSWSQAWGTEGYIKISRDHHGCGVPTNALYGIPDV